MLLNLNYFMLFFLFLFSIILSSILIILSFFFLLKKKLKILEENLYMNVVLNLLVILIF